MVLICLMLAACGRPTVDPLEFPADVEQFIPDDVDRSEVNRDTDGCYFYTYASSLFQVLDASGKPVCRPETTLTTSQP